MKPYHYRFENVLTYREQEKTETEVEFKASVESFEAVATKLYDLLKKKEDILLEQQGKMAKGLGHEIAQVAADIKAAITKRNEIEVLCPFC